MHFSALKYARERARERERWMTWKALILSDAVCSSRMTFGLRERQLRRRQLHRRRDKRRIEAHLASKWCGVTCWLKPVQCSVSLRETKCQLGHKSKLSLSLGKWCVLKSLNASLSWHLKWYFVFPLLTKSHHQSSFVPVSLQIGRSSLEIPAAVNCWQN